MTGKTYTFVWIESIIDSCHTFHQIETVDKLIKRFKILYPDKWLHASLRQKSFFKKLEINVKP